ncbi:MAG: hypothetical protein U1E25_14685 [Methylocystis sp.]
MSLSTKQVTARLGISHERVEQWISRGYFSTADNPGRGVAREWTLDDAIRLKATAELVEAALSPGIAAHHGKYAAWGKHQTRCFLIVKFQRDGSTVSEVVEKRRLSETLADSTTVIVLNLDNLRSTVVRALDEQQ